MSSPITWRVITRNSSAISTGRPVLRCISSRACAADGVGPRRATVAPRDADPDRQSIGRPLRDVRRLLQNLHPQRLAEQVPLLLPVGAIGRHQPRPQEMQETAVRQPVARASDGAHQSTRGGGVVPTSGPWDNWTAACPSRVECAAGPSAPPQSASGSQSRWRCPADPRPRTAAPCGRGGSVGSSTTRPDAVRSPLQNRVPGGTLAQLQGVSEDGQAARWLREAPHSPGDAAPPHLRARE